MSTITMKTPPVKYVEPAKKQPETPVIPSREVQEHQLMGEIDETYEETILLGGVRRRVFVSPTNVSENKSKNINLATCIIEEDEKTLRCHAVRIMGPAILKFDANADKGTVSIITHNELAYYVDPKNTHEFPVYLGCGKWQ